ncbi:two pore domain potassium channel family protein [Candidatus Pacearchaeota archaeon]|nr:two pore domain potassium channel family protein [Candidatus Pacearchaeota archaeon]
MKVRGNIAVILIIFLAFIIGGAFAYSSIEGWNLLDALYFLVMTVTTIGYGDFVPLTDSGKILTIFYAFFGVATALYVLSSISSSLFKKHVGEKVGEIKRDVKKEEKIKKEVRDTITKAVRKKK